MPEIRLRGGALDGLSLNYLVEGRGPAIILVHGLGGFAESWRHNVPALAERATVYAVDLPGFGRSGKPPGRYDLQFLARALHAFVDALGVSQVSLVGHSLGGAVCVTYALTHPAFVERTAPEMPRSPKAATPAVRPAAPVIQSPVPETVIAHERPTTAPAAQQQPFFQ